MTGSDAHRETLLRAGHVLVDLGYEIESLGAVLCSDPAFLARHGEALQALDRIAQHQHALATLLHADCAASAVAGISLADLQQRLRG